MKSGVVVQLKSGGPEMTIAHEAANMPVPSVVCQWFDNIGVLHTGTIPIASLDIIPNR